MSVNESVKNSRLKSIGLFLAYLAAALFIMSLIQSPGLINERAGVNSMSNFTAHKPFMYRALVPIMVRFIESITPGFIRDTINEIFVGHLLNLNNPQFANLPPEKFAELSRIGYRAAVFELLNLSFLIGFLYCLRYLTIELKLLPRFWSDITPLGIVFALPTYFSYGNFMYDFAALFLFTLGLIFLYQGKWNIYLLLLFFAILNKETAALLLVIYAIYYFRKLSNRQFWQLLIAQLAIFALVKIALSAVFISNPGDAVEWHLSRNLEYLSDISNYFRFDPIGAVPLVPNGLNIPLPRGLNILMIIVAGYFTYYGWRNKPQFLKISLVIVPIFFVIGMFMGYIDELRSYYEMLPIVYLLVISGLLQFIWKRKSIETK